MSIRQGRPATSYDAELLDMADRLFNEFADLPIRTVLKAIVDAQAALRATGALPTPWAVEERARVLLTTPAALSVDPDLPRVVRIAD